MVRLVGVEPTTGKTPVDFKPTAYANFATAAPATRPLQHSMTLLTAIAGSSRWTAGVAAPIADARRDSLDAIWRRGLPFLSPSPSRLMSHARQRIPFPVYFTLLAIAVFAWLAAPAFAQDSGDEGTVLRGNRPEIALTVRDSFGQAIAAPATVKLYRSGVPTGQQATLHGRAFFILSSLGDYSVTVEATGYQTATKELAINNAIRFEVEVNLIRTATNGGETPVAAKPILAPKAQESLAKALQALAENKLDDAQKDLNEASKLAPSHPDVLYAQGVLELKRRRWTAAQEVLEKATQIDPSHARALAALGMAFTDQGKYEEAVSPLEKSLQLDPASWEAQWTLGRAYYYTQRYDEALKESQGALAASNGKAPEIALLVAQSLTAVGRYNDAAQMLRDYLKNHNDRPEAATAKRWLDRLSADGKITRN
jgi:tetratricopeptide (TPR) repeat protein